MEQLSHCLRAKANYGNSLRAAATYHANEAFRLNEYENCGKCFKIFFLFCTT